MRTLTKEWLQKTIAELEEERDATPGAVNEDAAMALAAMKIALASLEAEPGVNHQPVAWQYKEYVYVSGLGYLWREKLDCEFPGAECETLKDVVPLYTAPPAPDEFPVEIRDAINRLLDSDGSRGNYSAVRSYEARQELERMLAAAPVSVPDESAVELLATDLMKRIDKITGERHSVVTLSSLRVSVVEACRAAMLQGADGSSPVIPDGWVACSERLPEETKDPDGGATGYLVLYAEGKEPNGGFSVGVWNVTYLRQWWRGFITHWMPLPTAPQQEV
ncbi:DUF551 domain-containing protein [Escherichia coli]|uniref:DUF551 domain-containing protein n=1 Tax=Escherichia coli TaxID=562 RepID=UPI001AECD6C3|nr:DUF551 domain-containing protein [Escherichia coli]MBP2745297.1 DUF551 domain-containing protein [Escherichia coli]